MNTSDTQLILKAQQGDMSAFEELVYRYDRQVLNIAKSFRNSDDDAKDIYQEVFIRVFRGIKNFQFKSEFSTWLFQDYDERLYKLPRTVKKIPTRLIKKLAATAKRVLQLAIYCQATILQIKRLYLAILKSI